MFARLLLYCENDLPQRMSGSVERQGALAQLRSERLKRSKDQAELEREAWRY